VAENLPKNSFQKSSKVVDFQQENRPGQNPQFSARRYVLFLRVSRLNPFIFLLSSTAASVLSLAV